jgi:hypothetical protein
MVRCHCLLPHSFQPRRKNNEYIFKTEEYWFVKLQTFKPHSKESLQLWNHEPEEGLGVNNY